LNFVKDLELFVVNNLVEVCLEWTLTCTRRRVSVGTCFCRSSRCRRSLEPRRTARPRRRGSYHTATSLITRHCHR